MITARAYPAKEGEEGVDVVVKYGDGVELVKKFDTLSKARRHYLDDLGWHEDVGGLWCDTERVLPAFVAVPRLSDGYFFKKLEVDVGIPVEIGITSVRVSGIPGSFGAFYYRAVELRECDPILSLASPLPVRIGAIGAWATRELTLEAAECYCINLMEIYGDAYFRKCVESVVRGELHLVATRHALTLDASRPGCVRRSPDRGMG